MKILSPLFLTFSIIFLASCAEPDYSGPPNPYQGTYIGTETLVGGSTVLAGDYPLKTYINARGRIRIVDVDGVSAHGNMEGNSFYVVRSTPRQVFDGTIENGTITGVTTENRYTGDGTFTLKLKKK